MRVSPDRIIHKDISGTARRGVLEIKSSDVDAIKLEWICQVMYQMHVVDVTYAHIAVVNLSSKRKLNVFEVEYDAEWWEWMRVRMEYFYQCIYEDVEPRLLRYIKKEVMEGKGNPQCEWGDVYPPIKRLRVNQFIKDRDV